MKKSIMVVRELCDIKNVYAYVHGDFCVGRQSQLQQRSSIGGAINILSIVWLIESWIWLQLETDGQSYMAALADEFEPG